MPLLVKRVVGSFSGTKEALGILLCPRFSKNEIYFWIISDAVITFKLYHEAAIYVIMLNCEKREE
jgi:hypothetical protein